jgi:hypothetical protein
MGVAEVASEEADEAAGEAETAGAVTVWTTVVVTTWVLAATVSVTVTTHWVGQTEDVLPLKEGVGLPERIEELPVPNGGV